MLRSPLQRVKSFTICEIHEGYPQATAKGLIARTGQGAKVLRGFGTTVPLTLQLLKPILSAVEIYLTCHSIGES
jgi:hypothetical protein